MLKTNRRKPATIFYGLARGKNRFGWILSLRSNWVRAFKPTPELREYQWKRREIENYIVCQKEVLMALGSKPKEKDRATDHYLLKNGCLQWKKAIDEIENARAILGR